MATVVELYEKLKPGLGEDGARALVEFIAASVQPRASTKEDLVAMEGRLDLALAQRVEEAKTEMFRRIEEVKSEMFRRIEEAKSEMIRRIEETKTEMIRRIEEARSEMIKWAFAFWIGNIAVMSGIIFVLLRAMVGK